VAAGALLADLHQKYDIAHQAFASGSTATVHLASHRTVQDGMFACSSSALVAKTTKSEFCAKREVAALVAIGSHPNVIPFHAVFATTSALGRSWTLLFDYEPGNLLQMLRPQRLLNRTDLKRILAHISAALAHVHAMGYIHCDVKPSNILVTTQNAFVLADFGLSVDSASSEHSCGTPGYIAPEIFNGTCTQAADIYSLGAVFYLCCCGLPLFKGSTIREVLRANKRGTVDISRTRGYIRALGEDLLTSLLQEDRHKRPEASDVADHVWLIEEEHCGGDSLTKEGDSITWSSTQGHKNHSTHHILPEPTQSHSLGPINDHVCDKHIGRCLSCPRRKNWFRRLLCAMKRPSRKVSIPRPEEHFESVVPRTCWGV